MQQFKQQSWVYLGLLVLVFTLSACPDDDETMGPPREISSYDSSGFFIVNSGGESGNGSISFYHRDYAIVKNKIFEEANAGSTLGLNVRSMKIIEGKGYIILNGSDKILVVNPTDMTQIGEINGFTQPRNIIEVSSGKAYVSQWGQDASYGSIQIVDLATNSILDSIPTRLGPEEMLRIGNAVYLANSGGIFVDSIITKISTNSDEVLRTIEVGKAPTYLEADKDLNLWVLTRGEILDPSNPDINIKGRLVKIEADEVALSINVRPAAGPLSINRTRDKLYFVQNGWVYEHPIENTSIALVPFIERFFSTFEIDPLNGNFIGAEPKDFVIPGDLYIYDHAKMPLDTVDIGKGPVGMEFWN